MSCPHWQCRGRLTTMPTSGSVLLSCGLDCRAFPPVLITPSPRWFESLLLLRPCRELCPAGSSPCRARGIFSWALRQFSRESNSAPLSRTWTEAFSDPNGMQLCKHGSLSLCAPIRDRTRQDATALAEMYFLDRALDRPPCDGMLASSLELLQDTV